MLEYLFYYTHLLFIIIDIFLIPKKKFKCHK